MDKVQGFKGGVTCQGGRGTLWSKKTKNLGKNRPKRPIFSAEGSEIFWHMKKLSRIGGLMLGALVKSRWGVENYASVRGIYSRCTVVYKKLAPLGYVHPLCFIGGYCNWKFSARVGWKPSLVQLNIVIFCFYILLIFQNAEEVKYLNPKGKFYVGRR